MAYYVVVGLGRFGHYLSLTLAERGADVVVIDKDVNAVEAVKDKVFQAVIGDGPPQCPRNLRCRQRRSRRRRLRTKDGERAC